MKRAVAMSVLTWNVGRQGLVQVFDKLEIPINVFTKKALLVKDKKD